MQPSQIDVIVIGGGIAGAAAAYEIAAFAPVILLEREPQCGYHSTGRSAASFTENYGSQSVRRLSMASRSFLETPPAGFAAHPLMSPRGMITIAREDQRDLLDEQLAVAQSLVPSITSIEVSTALERVPILRQEYVNAAFFEPDSRELDVNGLHQGFLRAAKARGTEIRVASPVLSIERRGESWWVATPSATLIARTLVNAAGAWADEIAALAGVAPLGLVPKRRTAFNVPTPVGVDCRAWPMIDDAGGEFYFKPDAGQLLVSPADATPSAPVDAHPEDEDVAIGVERLERATTLTVTRVSRSWAGLRTFATDGSPVCGWDTAAEGFFWLAGQGGYGIKTSPALARATAAQLRGEPLPDDLLRLDLTLSALSPSRLRNPAANFSSSTTLESST